MSVDNIQFDHLSRAADAYAALKDVDREALPIDEQIAYLEASTAVLHFLNRGMTRLTVELAQSLNLPLPQPADQ